MSLPLATLEGFSMYPDRRIQATRRAALARRLLATQRAHALYGLEADDLETLGGWWTRAKRKTSRVARKVGSITGSVQRGLRDSGIPLVSDAAKAGLYLSEGIDKTAQAFDRDKPAAAPTPIDETASKKNLLIPVGIAAVAAFFLFKR